MSDYFYLFGYISVLNIIFGWVALLLVGIMTVHLISIVTIGLLGGVASQLVRSWCQRDKIGCNNG